MEIPIKRGRGRPKIYKSETERRRAITESKNRYLLNKEWYCDVCNTGRDYKLAGKHCHLGTNKHRLNVYNIENQ